MFHGIDKILGSSQIFCGILSITQNNVMFMNNDMQIMDIICWLIHFYEFLWIFVMNILYMIVFWHFRMLNVKF